MTTAYKLDKKSNEIELDNLPELVLTRTNKSVIFDNYNSDLDEQQLYQIFAQIIDEGQSYPQDRVNLQEFKDYFLSHHCFVLRLKDTNETLGGFYIKPNFPGMSSHIANYGLVVKSSYRKDGLGHILMQRVPDIAKKLGFKALYTNLVYVNNEASIRLCKKYGFVEVGRLPKAGNLKGIGYVDALQFYKDLGHD